MLVFIKLTVIFQLTKIQNFLSEYALELAATDFDKIYSRNGAVQYEDYTVIHHSGTFHANSFRKLCINEYTTPTVQCRQPVRAQLPPGRLTYSCCLAGNCHTHAYTQ